MVMLSVSASNVAMQMLNLDFKAPQEVWNSLPSDGDYDGSPHSVFDHLVSAPEWVQSL